MNEPLPHLNAARYALASELCSRNWPKIERLRVVPIKGERRTLQCIAQVQGGDVISVAFYIDSDAYRRDTILSVMAIAFRSSIGPSRRARIPS